MPLEAGTHGSVNHIAMETFPTVNKLLNHERGVLVSPWEDVGLTELDCPGPAIHSAWTFVKKGIVLYFFEALRLP